MRFARVVLVALVLVQVIPVAFATSEASGAPVLSNAAISAGQAVEHICVEVDLGRDPPVATYSCPY
jgi:hypothetical protein